MEEGPGSARPGSTREGSRPTYGLRITAVVIVLLVVPLVWQQREIDALEARVDSLARAVAVQPVGGLARAASLPGRAAQREPRVGDARELPDEPHGSVRDAVFGGGRLGPASAADEQEYAAMADRVRDVDRGPRTAELREALVDVLEGADPELQTRLRAVVQDQQELERDERREKRQARWEEDTLGRLAGLSQQVGLDQSQQDALFALLSRARDLTGEAFRTAREDHSFGEAREKAAKFRQEADAEAREMLSDAQYTAYEAMRSEEMQRRGIGPGH